MLQHLLGGGDLIQPLVQNSIAGLTAVKPGPLCEFGSYIEVGLTVLTGQEADLILCYLQQAIVAFCIGNA